MAGVYGVVERRQNNHTDCREWESVTVPGEHAFHRLTKHQWCPVSVSQSYRQCSRETDEDDQVCGVANCVDIDEDPSSTKRPLAVWEGFAKDSAIDQGADGQHIGEDQSQELKGRDRVERNITAEVD